MFRVAGKIMPAVTLSCMGLMAGGAVMAAETETPAYDVISKTEAYEIREYKDMLVVETTAEGRMGRAMSNAFRPLADYIGGNNERREEIAMTAPVIATPQDYEETPDEQNNPNMNEFRVAFIMPSKYEDQESLPKPADERVKVSHLDSMRVAAVRFPGMGSSDTMEDKLEKLLDALKEHGIEVNGTPVFAKYDPPWTAPWKRRNEVLVPVKYERIEDE